MNNGPEPNLILCVIGAYPHNPVLNCVSAIWKLEGFYLDSLILIDKFSPFRFLPYMDCVLHNSPTGLELNFNVKEPWLGSITHDFETGVFVNFHLGLIYFKVNIFFGLGNHDATLPTLAEFEGTTNIRFLAYRNFVYLIQLRLVFQDPRHFLVKREGYDVS